MTKIKMESPAKTRLTIYQKEEEKSFFLLEKLAVEPHEGNLQRRCILVPYLPLGAITLETFMWHHASTNDGLEMDCGWFTACIFCNTAMMSESIENRWPLDKQKLESEHEMAMNEGIEYVDEVYASHLPITSDFYLEGVSFSCCPVCGWWCIIQQIHYNTPRMPYMAFQWAAGALTSQAFPKITAPLSEVRSYLCARYDQRFLIDPYQLEDVVASVFRSFKCDVHLSHRSHDGGLDIFGLDLHGQPFGVQVKRHRKRIGVEQLREFVGALTLHGKLRGVFVTTSSFTSGAPRLCGQAKVAGIQLECADAHKLFDMLKAAQICDFDRAKLKELAETYAGNISALNYGCALHMNSL